MVSEKFKIAIKLSPTPAYRFAQEAGVNPTTLSKLMCGIDKPRPMDSRIVAVGSLLGLSPKECFEDSREVA